MHGVFLCDHERDCNWWVDNWFTQHGIVLQMKGVTENWLCRSLNRAIGFFWCLAYIQPDFNFTFWAGKKLRLGTTPILTIKASCQGFFPSINLHPCPNSVLAFGVQGSDCTYRCTHGTVWDPGLFYIHSFLDPKKLSVHASCISKEASPWY